MVDTAGLRLRSVVDRFSMSSSPPMGARASSPSDARPGKGTVVSIDWAGSTVLSNTHGDDEASRRCGPGRSH